MRVVVEQVQPDVDHGRFAVKRVVGDTLQVTASIFADGHDFLQAELLIRGPFDLDWNIVPLTHQGNDEWFGQYPLHRMGLYRFFVRGWVDHFATWRDQLRRRVDAQQDVSMEGATAARWVAETAERATPPDRGRLQQMAAQLQSTNSNDWISLAFSQELLDLMNRWRDRAIAERSSHDVLVWVDRERARFSTWYEIFPRSCSKIPGEHGTFRDLETLIPAIAKMGFDVLYLPPIHPIGHQFRKGRNNSLTGGPTDPGVPWAIGNELGGHTAIHPQLGTLADFERLVKTAQSHGMEIALDFAVQCSPDHPWVTQFPEWFKKRPDGTIQYAENPPKKYQDIYPLHFESPDRLALWSELNRVLEYWIKLGVKIFRVDNPHTKPFAFWEYLIHDIRERHADVVFLSEAFTRPKLMYRLAKLGFTQSYTYFTWRNTKDELTQYIDEISKPPVSDFFRGNLWPNTPDILHEYLQKGGLAAFAVRYVLAATLSSNVGIYGPVYEWGINTPLSPGSEEYLDSEKYEIKHWDWNRTAPLTQLITRVNAIRRQQMALQRATGVSFLPTTSEHIIAYSRYYPGAAPIVVAVNLDPHQTRAALITMDVREFGLDPQRPFRVRDLLDNSEYYWQGISHYVELNPAQRTSHIFLVEQTW